MTASKPKKWTPSWVGHCDMYGFSPEARHYMEYFISIYNAFTNSKQKYTSPNIQRKIRAFIVEKALYHPEWIEQAFGYAIAKGTLSRDEEAINKTLFTLWCKRIIWDHCVKNKYLDVISNQSAFEQYCGLSTK